MISLKLAKHIGDKIGVDWDQIDLNQFHIGLKVELEHGSKFGKKNNVTKDDLIKTGKIALAHLLEIPDYYTRLDKMEKEAGITEVFSVKRFQKLAGIIKEDVVDLTDFRRQKERDEYKNEVVISSNGEIVSMPDEWKYVILSNRDQADALADGDLKKCQELGAKFFEVSPGDEIEIKENLNERTTPEFSQDLMAYLKQIPTENKNKSSKIGTNDSVDGPYTTLSKNQPFDHNNKLNK